MLSSLSRNTIPVQHSLQFHWVFEKNEIGPWLLSFVGSQCSTRILFRWSFRHQLTTQTAWTGRRNSENMFRATARLLYLWWLLAQLAPLLPRSFPAGTWCGCRLFWQLHGYGIRLKLSLMFFQLLVVMKSAKRRSMSSFWAGVKLLEGDGGAGFCVTSVAVVSVISQGSQTRPCDLLLLQPRCDVAYNASWQFYLRDT